LGQLLPSVHGDVILITERELRQDYGFLLGRLNTHTPDRSGETMSDVAVYWKQTKSLSKKLTGVDKLSPGFFSKGANITDPLEKYVVAWVKADPRRIGRGGRWQETGRFQA
jgi:hypothetical protein